MKPLPIVKNDYCFLNTIVMGPVHHRLLMTGIKLGVFDTTATWSTAESVCATLGTHEDNTRRLLDALVTIGLLQKYDGRYRNRPETAEFLVRQSPAYLGAYLQVVHTMCVASLDDLTTMVTSGPNLSNNDMDFSSETLWADMTRATAGWVTGGVGVQMAGTLLDLPEFPTMQRMLDLGGGHGMFALYFVDAHPTMTGVVFDQPAVLSVAREYIEIYGMQERVSILAGDYLRDDIGGGYDLIWACSTLNFAIHDLDALVTKIYQALNPGGLFISFQDGMTEERTQPDIMLGHLADAMRRGMDFSFRQGQISACMARCGFASVRSRTISTAVGDMDLDIAKKSD